MNKGEDDSLTNEDSEETDNENQVKVKAGWAGVHKACSNIKKIFQIFEYSHIHIVMPRKSDLNST